MDDYKYRKKYLKYKIKYMKLRDNDDDDDNTALDLVNEIMVGGAGVSPSDRYKLSPSRKQSPSYSTQVVKSAKDIRNLSPPKQSQYQVVTPKNIPNISKTATYSTEVVKRAPSPPRPSILPSQQGGGDLVQFLSELLYEDEK